MGMDPQIRINYEKDLPAAFTAANVTNCPLQIHPDTIEIIYVLKGEADVKISFENFTLEAGDFVVVNQDDYRFIKGKGADNAIVSFYIDMRRFEKQIRHIRYITFACESFAIDDCRKEYLDVLRKLIRDAVAEMALQNEGYEAAVVEKTSRIMSILVDHFTIVHYYTHEEKLSSKKLEKYYRIMKKLEDDYQKKSLLDEIAKSEFYSKFYMAHLYKGMMLMSIQDSLSAMRCFQSEKLLLTTNESIQNIAFECGFSDPKYYYKHFNKWFNCTPAQYRKRYQPEIEKETRIERIGRMELLNHLALLEPNEALALHARGGVDDRAGLFRYAAVELFAGNRSGCASGHDDSDVDWNLVGKIISDIRRQGLYPYVIMNFEEQKVDDWLGILERCCESYGSEIQEWEFCFYYKEMNRKESIRGLAAALKKCCPSVRINAFQRSTAAGDD